MIMDMSIKQYNIFIVFMVLFMVLLYGFGNLSCLLDFIHPSSSSVVSTVDFTKKEDLCHRVNCIYYTMLHTRRTLYEDN